MTTLDVKDYKLNENSIRYVICHLLKVTNYQHLNLSSICIDDKNNTVKIQLNSLEIEFLNFQRYSLLDLVEKNIVFDFVPSFDSQYYIPVISSGKRKFSDSNESKITIYPDILSLSFFLLSRFEEQVTTERDAYGRYEYKNSLSRRYQLIDIPLVDEYAMLLKTELARFFKEGKFAPEFKIILSQDIDFVFRFSGFVKSIKSLLGEIYLNRSIKGIGLSVKQFIKTINNPLNDPYYMGMLELLALAKRYNSESRLYFMSHYLEGVSSRQKIINDAIKTAIKEQEVKIGLHPDLGTYNHLERYNRECAKFRNFFGVTVTNNRQHFLQFDVRTTFDILESKGVKLDSSLGYAEREGFRCGTSHNFYPYNFKIDDCYSLLEQPLIVMDGTLKGYRKMNSEEARDRMKLLYNRTKRVNGNFVVLWHNDLPSRARVYTNEVLFAFFESIGSN